MPVISVLLVFGLVGCSWQNARDPWDIPLPGGRQPDPAMVKLAESAERIQADLAHIARVEQAGIEQPPVERTPATGDLAQKISLRWTGPVEPVVEMVASMLGWEFKALGRPPVQPPLVDVVFTQVPAYEILENIGWQVGKEVGIVPNRQDRVLAVIYRGDE